MSLLAWNIDPLTSDRSLIRRYRRRNSESNAWDDDCDCGNPPSAQHHSLCSVSPIYAELVGEFGIPRMDVALDLLAPGAARAAQMGMDMARHVIALGKRL